MITDLYSVEDWVTTTYDDHLKIIFVKWYNFTSNIHVRKSCEAQLDAMLKYKTKTIIADASEAIGVPFPEDHDWFISTLYPESKRLGLDTIVSILPKNLIAKSGARNWNNTGEHHGLNYVEVASMHEAFEYLRIKDRTSI